MAADDATKKHYQDLSRQGGELAVRYQNALKAGESRADTNAIAEELFAVVTELAMALLGDKVRRSRQSLSGVPLDLDASDLLQELHFKIFTALQRGGYTDDGKFKSWVLSIANNIFLDSLNYRKPKSLSDDQKDEEDSDEETLPQRGQTTAKRVVLPLDAMVGFEPGQAEDPERSLVNRELLNLILDGLRSVRTIGVEVWTARVFLGKDEAGILDLYDLKSNTGTGQFRRVSLDILAFVNQHEDYKGMPLKGLREIVLSHPMLEERDLALIADERQREALRHSVLPGMTIERLGELMGLSEAAAKKTLRAAIAALSQAKVRRVAAVAPAAEGPELDAWLWDEVGRMLAAYPEPPAMVRGEPSAGDGELAALCQVAVILAYSRDGVEPPKGFGELVGPRIQKDGLDATAKSLGLERPALMRVLAGSVGPEHLDSAMLGKLASHFDLEPRKVVASLRAGVHAVPGGRTRGLTPQERERYVESVRRRVLARIHRP